MTRDIEALLGELTLQEKAALTSGSGFWWTTPVPRLGIPPIMVADGPHGLRAQPGEGDHLGIGASLPATCFPPAAGIASSWNPRLLRTVGEALAREARACNLSVILGPGINMKRSPLCGRNFEYFSEDPYLAGELAAGIVDGIQSGDVGTSLKHFAANNQEDDRLRVDARVSERALREIYLPAFERVVTGCQPWTIMCSYNKVNGTSASQNHWLLTEVLRQEWGFEGLVVSDWGAVYDRVAALRAGLDLEMPPALGVSPEAVVAAVTAGEVAQDVLDERVRAVLRLVERGEHVLALAEEYDADAHHRLARAAAAESIVLLANVDGILPLAPGTRVGVIGEFARTPRFQGAGSSQVNPTRIESALAEARAVLGEDVPFAAGFSLDGDETGADALLAEAVDLARDVDTVLLFLGLPGHQESEGFDRTHLDLPVAQLDVLRAVAEVNANVVTVLSNGSVVILDEVVRHSRAVVEAWLGGQAMGGAIVDVLIGEVNPSGRLAESIPHRLQDNPSYLNFPGDSQAVHYGEGIFVGYRGYDASDQDVAFPFGFGLSYTRFELSDLDLRLSGAVAAGDLSAHVGVTVTNTGERSGAEVVQVYVRDLESTVARPVRELKGFAKVFLDPGESGRVRIDLDQRAFSFWSELLGRWAVEAGEFVIEVGHHSRSLPLAAIAGVDAPRVAGPLTRDSTLHEWLADPIGRVLLESVTDRAAEQGRPAGALQPEQLSVVGTMPMSTLANFAGMLMEHAELDALAARWREHASG